MIYAVSDIHGCYRQYREVLDKINFSDRDTLYVLIGCVPGTRTVNKNGMEVNVPEAYYKALLRYDHSSSIGPYLGIAFYIENEDVSGSYADYAMTIDALEEKIGMDLFPNIPDNYVTAAEASINSWWGL